MSRLRIEIGGGVPPAELPNTGMLAIGSDPERAGLVLSGQGVAEVHCAIGRTKDGGYAVKDLGSEYGTLVNGARITQARLQAGDELLLGSMRLRIVESSVGARAASPDTPAPAAAERPAGSQKRTRLPEVPGYDLQHRLGRGAMGDVYLAVQKSLDREVALKLLSKKHQEDAAFVRSFQAEARAAASLNHPNIVTVHDVGEHEGVHYLTMEYMDRGSLEVRVAKEGALPWPIVLGVLRDSASGLVYAESRGLVHRDIKPANLMQNLSGTTKIADLGLATSISEEDAGEGGQKILGTPHFISPEQIRGEKADARSDLYSLGSTAYRLLTGRTPFQGTSTREILRSKLREDPEPLDRLASDAPPALVEIVERLMQREPSDRYPSATALLRELERVDSSGGRAEAAAGEGAAGGVKRLAVPGAIAAVALVAAVAMFGSGDPPEEQPSTRPGQAGEVDPLAGAELPQLEDVTEAGPGDDGGPVDDDVAEKLFETSAENALLRLDQRDLTPAERRDALRALAAEFLGTSAGTRASEEAETIDQQLRETAQAESERESAVGGLLKQLEAAAGLDADPLDPGASLRAISAVPELASFAGDDGVQAEVRRLQGRVLSRALEQFDAAQAELDGLQAAGDFEGLRARLLALLARTELPAFEPGTEPEGASEVAARASGWRAIVENLDSLETRFLAEQRRADRLAIGERVGAGSGLLDDLGRLDFAAAADRTRALLEGLGSPDARTWAEALDADLRRAATALPLVWNNFSSWRRSSVSDPEDRRGTPRDALGASEAALVLDAGGGQRREVPWSAFGGNTKAHDMLFSKRLDRDYRAEEQEAIAALMHLSAVAESLESASEMFDPRSGAVFTSREAEELPAAFDRALEWCERGERRESLLADRQAAELLGRALEHGSEGSWTAAVALLEQLFTEHGDTWLVRLLSDGSPIALPGRPSPPAAPR